MRFVTGVDEHGEKIARAAEAAGLSPQEHCDGVAKSYVALWEALDIRYDAFVRTTADKHEAVVREFMERVWAKGDIYKSSYEGSYCVDCEEFKDEKQMTEDGDCLVHRRPCEKRSEENYFFRCVSAPHLGGVLSAGACIVRAAHQVCCVRN